MCGIAGYVSRRAEPERLAPMLDAIIHRGPDGHGRADWRSGDWHLVFGHRRLSIIDIEHGAQPMDMREGAYRISYNGEVYNFPALRDELEKRGYVFSTRSDTESVLAHIAERGEAGVADLNGMFAFAHWDEQRRRLLLARDRAGIKPLYYAPLPDGGLVFASELKSLLRSGLIDAELSTEAIANYLFSDYVAPPATIVRGVYKLAPGAMLVWENGTIVVDRRYWQAPSPSDPGREPEVLAELLWAKTRDAVRRQLIADVPVGIFLSGGIDSSIVAMLASEVAKERMKAFSIGFRDPTFDEIEHARAVARRAGVEHIEETLDESNLLAIVDEALGKLDEPMADPSLLPTYLLSRLAARHVKVVVGGDGGDELWAGYPTYKAHRAAMVYRRLPRVFRARVIDKLIDRLPVDDRYQSLEWKARRFAHRFDDDPVMCHVRWMSAVDLPDLARALPSLGRFIPLSAQTKLPSDANEIERMLVLDFSTYMSASVLTKVDRASMAHSLEVRPPLLDNELIEFAMRMPAAFKLRGGTGKWLLKRAARGHVPDTILDRKKKGFGIPLARWLRGPLRGHVGDLMASSPIWQKAPLDRGVIQSWATEHQNKRRDHAKALWALIALDRFARDILAK